MMSKHKNDNLVKCQICLESATEDEGPSYDHKDNKVRVLCSCGAATFFVNTMDQAYDLWKLNQDFLKKAEE